MTAFFMAVYDSIKYFESFISLDKPGPQKGIVGGIIKFIKKQEAIELPDGKFFYY